MGKLNGRFSEKTTVDTEELAEFIEKSLENREAITKRVMIGTINADAQKRIEAKCGEKANEIDIDNNGIVHALTQLHHNLEPEDLFLAVDVINTTTDIELSDEKHKDCDVLVFQKDIDGDITFLTEVHVKKGYLLIFDAWRQKKARSRRGSDAAKKPPRTYAQSEPPRNELSTISHKSDEKSSGGDETKARSRRRPDAAKKLPRAYAQNDPPRNELSTVSHKSDE